MRGVISGGSQYPVGANVDLPMAGSEEAQAEVEQHGSEGTTMNHGGEAGGNSRTRGEGAATSSARGEAAQEASSTDDTPHHHHRASDGARTPLHAAARLKPSAWFESGVTEFYFCGSQNYPGCQNPDNGPVPQEP